MRARLFARFGPEDGLDVEFGDEAIIGRSEESTIRLSSREVSQRHARIFFDSEAAGYWVEDLGSLNGTRLDGEPLSGRQRLGALHVLSFGATAELFFVGLDLEPGEPESAALEATGKRTRVDAEPPTLPAELETPTIRERTRVDSAPVELPPGLAAAGSTGAQESVAEGVGAEAGVPEDAAPGSGAPARPETARFVLDIRGGGGGSFELRRGRQPGGPLRPGPGLPGQPRAVAPARHPAGRG